MEHPTGRDKKRRYAAHHYKKKDMLPTTTTNAHKLTTFFNILLSLIIVPMIATVAGIIPPFGARACSFHVQFVVPRTFPTNVVFYIPPTT